MENTFRAEWMDIRKAGDRAHWAGLLEDLPKTVPVGPVIYRALYGI